MTKIVSNYDLCRRKCLDCGYDGCETAKDSCVKCGHRYHPTSDNESCPECGCPDYDTHCPECDSDQILYWDEYQEYLKEKEDE